MRFISIIRVDPCPLLCRWASIWRLAGKGSRTYTLQYFIRILSTVQPSLPSKSIGSFQMPTSMVWSKLIYTYSKVCCDWFQFPIWVQLNLNVIFNKVPLFTVVSSIEVHLLFSPVKFVQQTNNFALHQFRVHYFKRLSCELQFVTLYF